MIEATHRKCGYGKLDGYNIVLLGTHPLYDVLAPGNGCKTDFDSPKLIQESGRKRTHGIKYYLESGRVFLHISIYCGDDWNLADKIVDSLHQVAVRRLKDVWDLRSIFTFTSIV